MMNAAELAKRDLNDAIREALAFRTREMMGEGLEAFSRKRKLDAETVIKMVCFFGGNSLEKEIFDYPNVDVKVPSFIDARKKLEPELFYDILMRFCEKSSGISLEQHKFKSRSIIGLDGSHVSTAFAPGAPSFIQHSGNPKGYNQYRAVVLADLLSHMPIAVGLSPIGRQGQDELGAAMGMLAFQPLEKSAILCCDRLYSSYGFLVELQQAGTDFVIRAKAGAGAKKPIRDLGPCKADIEDHQLDFVLTNSQSRESKARGEIFISPDNRRSNPNSRTSAARFYQPLPYHMKNIRAVRAKITKPSGVTETEVLLTSLKQEDFSAEEIVQIYKLRWNLELYFRHIKVDCGLHHMHSKREDLSIQQIYGAFIASALTWRIVNSIVIENNPENKYLFKANMKMATYLIKQYMKTPNADGGQLLKDISCHVVPIQEGRATPRQMHPRAFTPFVYRIT